MILEILIIIFLMIAAIVLILLEIFMLPGMIAGIIGGLFAAGGVIYAYRIDLWVGNLTLAVSSVTFVIAFAWLMRSGSFRRVALNTEVGSRLTSSRDLGIVPGDEGITLSRLAPIGKARIKGIIVEARSLDELIDEKTEIEVVRVDGSNVIVKNKHIYT